MVKIAKSLEKDIAFVAKLRILEQHMLVHKTLPNHINDKKLYNFIIKLRQKHRQDPNLCFWEWRVPMLMRLGIDITASATIKNSSSPSNIEPNWRDALYHIRAILDHSQLRADLAWFNAIVSLFETSNKFPKRYKTLQELIVKLFQAGDMKASECTRTQPMHELKHTLSYICTPLSFLETSQPLVPFWRLKDYHDHSEDIAELPIWTVPFRCGNSVCFSSSSFNPKMFEGALGEVSECHDFGCDHHTLSAVEKSIEQCPEIAKLKINIWKKVYHWLSPLSKTCPPNGVHGFLHSGTHTHQDNFGMAPDSGQLIGSSVIVVSFFDVQLVRMCKKTKTMAGDEFPTHDYFSTEHCSVHVLDPQDANLYHHKATFPASRKSGLRYALTFCWLGNQSNCLKTKHANDANTVSI